MALGRAGTAIAGAFGWWGGALASCLPVRWREFVRAAFVPPRREVIVLFDGDRVEIAGCQDATIKHLGTVNADDRPERARAQIASAVQRGRMSGADVVVALPSSQVMKREFTLPLNVEPELKNALEFMVESQTPLKLDQSYWTWRVLHRDTDAKTLRIALFVAPRWVLDGARDTAVALRLRPARYDVVDSSGADVQGVDLSRRGREIAQFLNAPNTWRLAFVLALIALAVAMPIARQHASANSGRIAAEEARPTIEAAAAVERRIRAIEREREFFDRAREQSVSPLAVFSELSRVLDDQTWLFEVRLNRGEATISGSSSVASSLIAVIDGSPMFANARFSAALTQGDEPGVERFSIAFNVVRPAPGGEP